MFRKEDSEEKLMNPLNKNEIRYKRGLIAAYILTIILFGCDFIIKFIGIYNADRNGSILTFNIMLLSM